MKPFPTLTSDEDAEDFVVGVDLTEYDPSEMVTIRFERTGEAGTVVLPDALLAASREKAAHLGIPLDVFVRSAIERALTTD
ncbi:CopG family antitoxin [Lichenibacterium dinghuense]|uniref:CopG family antitoxin n=1 Tax=Lichenibacterium dinghuense TaxID=2895977 RepID=UPI001F32B87C|nr:CopG family antitoxin [Lichenibacterium sp. 6Y81]